MKISTVFLVSQLENLALNLIPEFGSPAHQLLAPKNSCRSLLGKDQITPLGQAAAPEAAGGPLEAKLRPLSQARHRLAAAHAQGRGVVPFQIHSLIPASQRLYKVKPADPHFTINGVREVGPWSKVTQARTEAGLALSPSDVHACADSTAQGRN